jgi:hypothetical protein
MSHVVDLNYMGVEVAREVVEAYYKIARNVAQPLEAQHPLEISNIVEGDFFNVGPDPAKVLRGIAIRFSLDNLVDGTGYIDLAHMQQAFEQLLRMKKKPGFKLRIELRQYHVRLRLLAQSAFEGAEAEVAITWKILDTSGGSDPERSLDDIVRHPTTGWKEEFTEYLENVPGIAPEYREYRHEDLPSYDPKNYGPLAHDDEEEEDMDPDDAYLHGPEMFTGPDGHHGDCPCDGCHPWEVEEEMEIDHI